MNHTFASKRPPVLVASDTAPDLATYRQHHYVAKMAALVQRERLDLVPGVHHVSIAHDEWCAIFHGGACNCDPTVTLRGDPHDN
jgi:hypothetical protein